MLTTKNNGKEISHFEVIETLPNGDTKVIGEYPRCMEDTAERLLLKMRDASPKSDISIVTYRYK